MNILYTRETTYSFNYLLTMMVETNLNIRANIYPGLEELITLYSDEQDQIKEAICEGKSSKLVTYPLPLVTPICDCGAEKAHTTHAHWCSIQVEEELK